MHTLRLPDAPCAHASRGVLRELRRSVLPRDLSCVRPTTYETKMDLCREVNCFLLNHAKVNLHLHPETLRKLSAPVFVSKQNLTRFHTLASTESRTVSLKMSL